MESHLVESSGALDIFKDCRIDGLTQREQEVLWWIAQGKTNWEIGKILGISIHTVSKHVEHLFLKLKVHSRVQAIKKCLELSQKGNSPRPQIQRRKAPSASTVA